ncbi:MAG: hypothetical protein JOZ19_15005 [Rubrobacter sp.]|nr:hypothetical protein [Rubrobacter sp.]
MIILCEDYENMPSINLFIQNVSGGSANLTFDFSWPVDASGTWATS